MCFFFQAEDGIRDIGVTGVQTCALPITKPPRRYSDASMLAAMETAGKLVDDEELREAMKDSGIGTPATGAAIIERLIDVGYIERAGRSLVATEKELNVIRARKSVVKGK